jgi:AraC-like DNA-binding protein
MEPTSVSESLSGNGLGLPVCTHPNAPIGATHCRMFLRELRARGINPQRQLALLGISHFEHDEVACSISVAQFSAFLRLVEQLSGDPDIGLHAGQQIRTQDVDLIELLMRRTPDACSAYENYAQSGGTIQEPLDLEVTLFGGMLICRRSMPGVPASRTLSDYFLARTITLMRQVLGPVEPLEVRVTYARPPAISEQTRLLGTRLRFGEREDALLFPVEILFRGIPNRDPVTAEILLGHLKELSEARASCALDLAERTRQVISAQLQHGQASVREVAVLLKLSERTFRRRLRLHGTSFQGLLDEVRREQALYYFCSTSCTASEVSGRLGFNGAPAFYRAFRRWTGVSLREYRAELAPGRTAARPRKRDSFPQSHPFRETRSLRSVGDEDRR